MFGLSKKIVGAAAGVAAAGSFPAVMPEFACAPDTVVLAARLKPVPRIFGAAGQWLTNNRVGKLFRFNSSFQAKEPSLTQNLLRSGGIQIPSHLSPDVEADLVVLGKLRGMGFTDKEAYQFIRDMYNGKYKSGPEAFKVAEKLSQLKKAAQGGAA